MRHDVIVIRTESLTVWWFFFQCSVICTSCEPYVSLLWQSVFFWGGGGWGALQVLHLLCVRQHQGPTLVWIQMTHPHVCMYVFLCVFQWKAGRGGSGGVQRVLRRLVLSGWLTGRTATLGAKPWSMWYVGVAVCARITVFMEEKTAYEVECVRRLAR